MVTLPKWTTLSFDLDIPVSKYPALVERLAGTPARLEEKIGNAPFMILAQPYNNGWSIQEHTGHLADLEELILNRLDDFEAGKDVLTAADMSNKKTYDAYHNDRDINHILKEFRASRQAIIKRLVSYDEQMVQRKALHPRLNKLMSIIGLVYFSAEHDDHHLASMSVIERELS